MSNNITHNQGIIVDDHTLVLDHANVDIQLIKLPVSEKSKVEKIDNKDQDQVMIKIDDKEKKKMQHITNKSLKKFKIIKEKWSSSEDRLLLRMVARNGTKNWREIAKMFKKRVGKQCRDRWLNHLCPDIKKDIWTEEEDHILIEAHKEVGNKWTTIADKLPGRSENNIKNHWNATKRLEHSWRTKGKDLSCTNILMKYIRSIADDNNSATTIQNVSSTVIDFTIQESNSIDNTPQIDEFDEDELNSINKWLMDPTLEAEMEALTDGFTTSTYTSTPTMSTCEEDFRDIEVLINSKWFTKTSEEFDELMKTIFPEDYP